MSRWKDLPHRLSADHPTRAGQCRDCGWLEPGSAPDTCARCAMQRYAAQGFFVLANPVLAFEQQGRELWRGVAKDLRAGQIATNRFYLWVGHGDGGPLERASDEVLPEREFIEATVAHETALDLTRRYPQIWVVTTVGCWNVGSSQLT